MWRELIADVYPEAEFGAPTTQDAIEQIERRLGQTLPADLRSLLTETDGVRDTYLVGVVWSIEQISTDNLQFRTFPDFAELYAPFDDLLFFGDNGGGDQFAYRPDDPKAGIFVWDHETDERRRVADDLADYLRRRLPSDGDTWYSAYQ